MGKLVPLTGGRIRAPLPTTALVTSALAAFEEKVGGRAALIKVLLGAAPSSHLDYVVGLIADPSADGVSLAELCAKGKVSVGELLEAYKSGLLMQAQVAAFHRMAGVVDRAVADFVEKAVPHEVRCDACNGTGRGRADKATGVQPPCDTCRGTGTLHKEGDLERQVKLFEYLQLQPPKGGGPVVNNFIPPAPETPPGESLALMLKAMDRVLHPQRSGEGDAIDGEAVVDPDATPSPAPTP